MGDDSKTSGHPEEIQICERYGDCLLIETEAKNILEVTLSSLKNFTDRGCSVIVLSSSRPCTTWQAIYRRHNIDSDSIYIVDTICKSQGLNVADSKNVVHVNGLGNLTDISIEIDRLSKGRSKTILFIDSLTTMLIHNDHEIFCKFLHSVLNKTRANGVDVAMVMLKLDEYKPIKEKLGQLVDEIITV